MMQKILRKNTITTQVTKCLREWFSNQKEKQKRCEIEGGEVGKEGKEKGNAE